MQVYCLQGTMVAGQEVVGMRHFRENCVAVGKMFFAVRGVNHGKLASWSDGVTSEATWGRGFSGSSLRHCVLQKVGPVIFRGPWQCRYVLQGCTTVCWQILSRGLNHKCVVSSLTSRVLSFPFCQVQGHRVQQTFRKIWSWFSCRKKCCYHFVWIESGSILTWMGKLN